jgi:hypothetical protein
MHHVFISYIQSRRRPDPLFRERIDHVPSSVNNGSIESFHTVPTGLAADFFDLILFSCRNRPPAAAATSPSPKRFDRTDFGK